MITGDKSFGPGNARYELQRAHVEELKAVYWGRGSAGVPDASGFDIVTSQDPFLRGLAALRAARRAKAKLNIQVHADLKGQSWWKRLIARYVLRRADSIRVVSQRAANSLESMRLRATITVLSVFVDSEAFRKIVPVPHEGKIILWIGRFEREKDPLGAIEIYKGVRAAGIDAKLVMLGKGSLEKSLRAEAEGLPVDFPGWVDPKPYLAQADVVLCTSRHESWGASIVEALAAGVPVVAPDVGIAREAGATVVPRSDLAKAVAEVVRSGTRGALAFPLLSPQEYAAAFAASLS
ncbi:MAG TPA: glycosyltransferase [Candidatus Paceibacterota bacterium]|nr:glycosyltransferase [Candidatus Paceibacterota bacterium]